MTWEPLLFIKVGLCRQQYQDTGGEGENNLFLPRQHMYCPQYRPLTQHAEPSSIENGGRKLG